jgi:hypothetical protein
MCGTIDLGHTYDEYMVLLAKSGMTKVVVAVASVLAWWCFSGDRRWRVSIPTTAGTGGDEAQNKLAKTRVGRCSPKVAAAVFPHDST